MVQTVEQNFGARIDYWAVTSFWGITRMVETIGGLQIRAPFRRHYTFSGSKFEKGFRGSVGAGSWRSPAIYSVPGGDFGRQENGVASSWPPSCSSRRSSARTRAGCSRECAGVRNTESNLPVDELVDLAFAASGIRFADVQNVVLPGGTGNVGGLSVVRLSMGTAR